MPNYTLTPARLLDLTCECFTSYNPHRITPSTHIETFLSQHNLSHDDATFITTLFELHQRYHQLIDVTLDGMYDVHAATLTRTDRVRIGIIVLLAVIKLQDVAVDSASSNTTSSSKTSSTSTSSAPWCWSDFRTLILSQTPHKMYACLSFLWNDDLITPSLDTSDPTTAPPPHPWLYAAWSTIYDVTYVRDVLLGNIAIHRPAMTLLLQELQQKITHATSTDTNIIKKPVTRPRPFDLTQPKGKPIPMPTVVIENTVKANPVPKDILYETSLSAIEREKESRAKRTLEETTAKHRASHPPDLATAHRPSHIEQLKMEAMIAEKEATTIKHHARPVPAYIYTNTDMIETNNNDSINKAQAQALIIPKQTTTTILREELLYRRQQEEKLAELSKYEHELRDANDFHQWQIEMRERDEQQRMAEIEARKEEMARAAEDAKAAMIKQQQLNAQHAATLKEEARQRIAQAEQEAEKEIQSKRQQAIMIAKEKEQIAISQAAIVVKKKALAAQELAIKEQHQAEVEKQKQDELKQRRELIRQIQAMEKLASVKAKKPKEVDVTTTSGLGLLSEMSIIELHARIELLQQQQRDQRDAKRDAILKYKQEKKEILENMARQHVRLRKAAIVKGAQERKEIKAEREAAIQAKQIEEEKEHAAFAEKMSAQRDAKRLEALKLAKELKEKRLRATFYANEKLELAKKREQDLLLAKKREEVTSLSKLTAEEKQAAITAAIDEQDRQRAATRVKQEKEYAQKRYDAHVKAMRRENIATQEEDLALKQTQARYVREREEETIAAIHKQQPWLKPKEQDSTLDRTRIRKSTGTLSSTTSIPSKTLTRTSRSSTTSPTQLPVPAV